MGLVGLGSRRWGWLVLGGRGGGEGLVLIGFWGRGGGEGLVLIGFWGSWRWGWLVFGGRGGGAVSFGGMCRKLLSSTVHRDSLWAVFFGGMCRKLPSSTIHRDSLWGSVLWGDVPEAAVIDDSSRFLVGRHPAQQSAGLASRTWQSSTGCPCCSARDAPCIHASNAGESRGLCVGGDRVSAPEWRAPPLPSGRLIKGSGLAQTAATKVPGWEGNLFGPLSMLVARNLYGVPPRVGQLVG